MACQLWLTMRDHLDFPIGPFHNKLTCLDHSNQVCKNTRSLRKKLSMAGDDTLTRILFYTITHRGTRSPGYNTTTNTITYLLISNTDIHNISFQDSTSNLKQNKTNKRMFLPYSWVLCSLHNMQVISRQTLIGAPQIRHTCRDRRRCNDVLHLLNFVTCNIQRFTERAL